PRVTPQPDHGPAAEARSGAGGRETPADPRDRDQRPPDPRGLELLFQYPRPARRVGLRPARPGRDQEDRRPAGRVALSAPRRARLLRVAPRFEAGPGGDSAHGRYVPAAGRSADRILPRPPALPEADGDFQRGAP